jgi:glycerophosphoryl diester phosphodiesterase
MWADLPRPIIIAHRGDKTNAPENTLAAFRLANENGADAVEFDVKLTADGQVIVLHDQTVDEAFETVGKQLYINVELTNYATPFDGLALKVVELVKKHGLQNRMLFSSFFAQNLKGTRSLLPQVPCGLLCMRGTLGSWGRTFTWRGNYFALHPYLTDVDPGLVHRVQAAGKRVHVWTVNPEEDLKRMIGLGVDGIITDDPVLALHLLGRAM